MVGGNRSHQKKKPTCTYGEDMQSITYSSTLPNTDRSVPKNRHLFSAPFAASHSRLGNYVYKTVQQNKSNIAQNMVYNKINVLIQSVVAATSNGVGTDPHREKQFFLKKRRTIFVQTNYSLYVHGSLIYTVVWTYDWLIVQYCVLCNNTYTYSTADAHKTKVFYSVLFGSILFLVFGPIRMRQV